MLSRCVSWLRTRRAPVAIAMLVALATVGGAGCSTFPPSSAPSSTASPWIAPSSTAPLPSAPSEVLAARELAVSDLLPAFEWPEPATVSTTVVAPPTTVAPASTAGEDVSVVGDPLRVEAMALLVFPWRSTLPGWSIAFLPAQAGLRGLTKVDDRRIEIYLRDGDSVASLARVVAHELGHAIDVALNSPSDRERWRAVRGAAPSVAWWPGNAVSDFDTLAGDFAEAFATMLTGSVSLSRVAPAPGPAQLAVLAELAAR